MKISVIIPVYNAKKYLERCINSILQQTFKDMEVILVDDGSTDGSGALADRLSAQDLRARVIHQKNMGISSARNTGIQAAQGEYIIFIDSDDEWLINDGLERILKESPIGCDMIVFNIANIWRSDRHIVPKQDYDLETIKKLSSPQAIFSYLVKSQKLCITSWTVIIRRSLLIDNNILFKENLVVAEDLDWSLHIWQVIKHVSFHNLHFYGWHHRPGSLSQTISIRSFRSNDQIFSFWKEQCKNNCVNKEAISIYLANRWVNSSCNYTSLAHSEKREALYILKAHQDLLYSGETTKARVSSRLVTLFGVEYTCIILGTYRKLRKLIKRQGI